MEDDDMDKEHTCCVTGHRDIPEGKKDFVRSWLAKLIQAAIDGGCTHFISGFAAGVDYEKRKVMRSEI